MSGCSWSSINKFPFFYPLDWFFPTHGVYLHLVAMLVNASFSTSLPPVSLPYCASVCYFIFSCLNYTTVALVVTIFSITRILLLLPLLIFAFCDALQQQQQRRTRRTSSQPLLFTYHMMVFELLGVFGSVACLCGTLTDYRPMKIVWLYVLAFTVPGQTYLHALISLEHYLAVLHPIIFRRLKEAKMIRNRNVGICFIWLLCCVEVCLISLNDWTSIITFLCSMWFNFCLCSFCSISVLCALIRPELERRVGDRQQTGKFKPVAFYTVTVILGGLWLRFLGQMLILFVFPTVHMGMAKKCIMAISGFWFGFPTSLMLPMLFVYRTRKRYKCRNSNQQKQAQLRSNCHAVS